MGKKVSKKKKFGGMHAQLWSKVQASAKKRKERLEALARREALACANVATLHMVRTGTTTVSMQWNQAWLEARCMFTAAERDSLKRVLLDCFQAALLERGVLTSTSGDRVECTLCDPNEPPPPYRAATRRCSLL